GVLSMKDGGSVKEVDGRKKTEGGVHVYLCGGATARGKKWWKERQREGGDFERWLKE
ncbi:unnamed protein product, partial [Ilex paraguariensis]